MKNLLKLAGFLIIETKMNNNVIKYFNNIMIF